MRSETHNVDCMEFMSGCPDKCFELAIVDPPYGINIAKENPRVSGRWNYIPKQWDSAVPTDEYFAELKRVSTNQIVWGGNYFTLGTCRGFVIWDKNQPVDNFADSEFAWTSFDRVSKTFRYSVLRQNFIDGKIHPTQKPTALYRWLLTNYAKQGDRIFDSHLGSGSSRIAAYDLGFDFVGTELDKDYFEAQEQRFADHIAQPKLWTPEVVTMEQGTLI